MPVAEQVPPMLTVPEAARRLAVSEATVRRLAASGDLMAVRVGRQLRFPPDSIEALTTAAVAA